MSSNVFGSSSTSLTGKIHVCMYLAEMCMCADCTVDKPVGPK